MTSTTPETIKAARKAHRCDWCNERIEVGGSYVRWRWFDSRDAYTCRLHPECQSAMGDFALAEGGYAEWTPGDFSRGCTCVAGGCECEKGAPNACLNRATFEDAGANERGEDVLRCVRCNALVTFGAVEHESGVSNARAVSGGVA